MERFQMTRSLKKSRTFAGLVSILIFALIAPSAIATSIVAQADLEEEEQAPSSTPFRALTNDQIQFLEDNWYFTVDDLVTEDADEAPAVSEQQQAEQDEIKFREDNWYYEPYDNLPQPQVEIEDPDPPMTRGYMRFLEENIELGLAPPDQADDEDDQDADDQDEGYDDDYLPHPHGGDSTELDW